MSYQIIKNSYNGEIMASNQTYNYNDKEYTGAIFKITIPVNYKN